MERLHLQPFAGDAVPQSAEGYDGLVLLGGGQNALDDANHPWFEATLELIRDFGRRDRPVLGLCLGAQLIARAYDGTNKIGGHYEFGWHRVGLTEEGRADPLFAGVAPEFSIFEWHEDHFSLPPGAVQLASTPVAENQAFRIGRATYGTQFHFEADQTMVEWWSGAFAGLLAEREPDWANRHPREAARHGNEADAAGRSIARNWAALLRAG